jgi:hypothetical protein
MGTVITRRSADFAHPTWSVPFQATTLYVLRIVDTPVSFMLWTWHGGILHRAQLTVYQETISFFFY